MFQRGEPSCLQEGCALWMNVFLLLMVGILHTCISLFSQCLTPAEMLLQMAKQASRCIGAVLWLSADLSELAVERPSGPL